MSTANYTIPESSGGDPAGSNPAGGSLTQAIRLFFQYGILQVAPPWLQRRVGSALLRSIGEVTDNHIDRLVEGVRYRFPNGARPDALGVLGADRRLRRGPGEDSVTYAARLRSWLDAHRTRGSTGALLAQVFEYFRASLSVPIEIVDYAGNRHLVAPDGTITRDRIIWGGDGSGNWARVWVMINLPDTNLPVPILNAAGEPVLDGSGNPTFNLVNIFALTEAERELLCAVPRDWSAAHIERTTVVLLHPGVELWGYRDTTHPPSDGVIGTWADDDPEPGQVWQTTDPVLIEC